MLKLLKVGLLIVGLLGLNTAFADSKIGILDMQQVMQQSPEVANLNKQLQDQFKPRQEKIMAAQKNLQDEMGKMNKDAAVMNDKNKEKMVQKINADRQAYQTLVQSFQQDLNSAQNKVMQKFMGNLQNAVNSVAKEGQYTMVLNRAAVPYFDPAADVTKQVLSKISNK
jgi:outer membrane protein